jgi:hypothetical protein
MDQELIAYLEERFRETSRQIEAVKEENTRCFEQIDQRFEKAEEDTRHTQVMLEGVRGNIQLLAEGMLGVDEKLAAFKLEVSQEFESVRNMIRNLPYSELERRIRTLEAWREVKDGDPIEIIRERFGLRRS